MRGFRIVGTAIASQALGLVLGAGALTTPMAAHADMLAAAGKWQCLANEGGAAVLRTCSASRHNNQINYLPGSNEFYGPLRQAGQCLDVQGGRVMFAGCNGSQGQIWKYGGASGQLNNQAGFTLVPSGASIIARSGPGLYLWANASYRLVTVPGFSAPRGTPLRVSGSAILNANTGAVLSPTGGATLKALGVVSNDGGSIISQDGGGLIAQGAGNLIAQGAGNVAAGRNVANLIAQGAGN